MNGKQHLTLELESALHTSIINRFFLSLDLFSIELDPFQHTPWLIITSLTYQELALDSASGLGSFTLQSTRYHGNAK